jgi:AraC-like DNA-binding protein
MVTYFMGGQYEGPRATNAIANPAYFHIFFCMAYAHRCIRLIPLNSPPLKQLLRGACYAVDEAVLPGFVDGSRRTNYWAILYTVSGTSDYRINGERVRITPGSLLLLPSGISFSEKVAGPDPCHNRYLMLDGTPAKTLSLLIPKEHPFVFWPRCPKAVTTALWECVSTVHAAPEIPPWRFGAALCRLLDALARHNPLALPSPVIAARVRALLETDPGGKWTVGTLAGNLGMSVSAFAHQFRHETGVSPAAFVRRERCVMGRGFLEAGVSVTATSAHLGFANPYHFSRVFKSEQGAPPSAFVPARGRLHRAVSQRGMNPAGYAKRMARWVKRPGDFGETALPHTGRDSSPGRPLL